MIHLFNSRSWSRDPRRAGAAIAGVLVAAGAMLAVGPAAMAAVADGPLAADAVAAALRISPPKAEIVILVDVSISMGADAGDNDLYPQIRGALNTVLSALAAQRPHDRVAVIDFAQAANEIYDGRVSTAALAMLPRVADEDGSNIAAAFQLADQTLQNDVASSGIRAGAILLLSDAELNVLGEPQQDTYGAAGWGQLRTAIAGLPVKVTGYGLHLTSPSGQPYADLQKALKAVLARTRRPIRISSTR